MPTVISPPKQNKQVECRTCGAVIGYNLSEVQSRTYRDYDGTQDTDYFIKCPCCGSEIYVKSY